MSVLSSSRLKHDILLMPLSFEIFSSRILPLYLFLSFCSFSVSDALFNPLAHFSHLVSVNFHDAFSFFNERSDFIVSFSDLFIFAVL